MRKLLLIAAAVGLLLLTGCGSQPVDTDTDRGTGTQPSSATETVCLHRDLSLTERVEPTCTEDGYELRVCPACGWSERLILPAAGHDWSGWTATVPSSDPTADRETRSCAVCGETEERMPVQDGTTADPTACDALAQLPPGEGTYYSAASAAELRRLAGIYRTRRDGLNGLQLEAMAEALREARGRLSYVTNGFPTVYLDFAGEPDAEYGPAAVVFVNADGTVDHEDAGAVARIHGNSTSWGAKKSYNLKLTEKARPYGIDKSKKWVLIGNQLDCTRLRNVTVYELARLMGLPFTPDWTFVEAFVDGKFWGSYLLIEKVDVSKNSVDIDTDRGDFLLEVERLRKEEDVVYLRTEQLKVRFGINEPEVPTEEQLAAMRSVLSAFEAALTAGDWNALQSLMDTGSFVDYYLLHELCKDVDCGTSSTRFFCEKGVLRAGPVWDFDLSLGNATKDQYPSYFRYDDLGVEGLYATREMAWFGALMKIAEFKALVTERYRELIPVIEGLYAEDAPEGSFLDRTLAACRDSFERTSKLAGCRFYQYTLLERIPDKTYEKNLSFLREWLRARDHWLRGSFGLG